jgi:type II secretory pathway pseudopilin PulG
MNDRRSGLDDGGYILVALLISIAIASVWMAAALPSWRQQVMREREAELIFRGEQYARAIRLYQNQMGGTLPITLDDLVSQHVLRHKWKDPITGDEFLPRVGCFQVVGRGATAAGICGVQSKSKAASIKIYNGQQQHDLWQFDVNTASMLINRNIVRLGGAAAPAIALPGGRPGGPVGPGGIAPPGRRGGPGSFTPVGRGSGTPFGPAGPGAGLPGRGGAPPTVPPQLPPSGGGRGGGN